MAQRIAIIALTCDRIDEAFQTWHHNLKDTPYMVYWWDNSQVQANRDKLAEMAEHFGDRIVQVTNNKAENIGIAKALNNLMQVAFSLGHEICVTMADDLIEVHDYPRLLVEALDLVPNAGIAASPPSEGSLRYERESTNGIRWETGDVIGNWAIPKTTFDAVGPLPEYYGIYGPIDLDYCARVRKAGLLPIYRSDIASRHIGTSTPQTHAYEKQVSLNDSWPIYSQKMRELEA